MTVTVKTVSVTYGRKFNLGDFNSATVARALHDYLARQRMHERQDAGIDVRQLIEEALP